MTSRSTVPTITEEEIDAALETITTTGVIKGVAEKIMENIDLNWVTSLELRDHVNEFLNNYELDIKDKIVLKIHIIKNLDQFGEVPALENFSNMQAALVKIIDNIKTLKNSEEGRERLNELIKSKRIGELENESPEELEFFLDS